MADTLNDTPEFSGADIYNGGGAAFAVLEYVGPNNISLFFTPMLQLDILNGAAADITVEVWLAYAKNDFFKFYTSGAVSKDPDASTKFVWTYPDGIIPFIKLTAVKVEIRVHSTNTNDTSVSGFVWLLNAKMNSPYSFETTVETVTDDKTLILTTIDGFQETNNWYINQLIEISDSATGNVAIRRIVDQINDQLVLESDLPFTPVVLNSKARMLKTYYGDIGTVNGSTPISTGDIKDAIEAEGSTLDTLDDLTKAAGDGDLAAILIDTNELQTDDIPATLATIANKVDINLGAIITVGELVATVDVVVDNILIDTDTTLPGILVEMKGASFDTATDSLKSIRDRGDAAWGSGAGIPRIED